MHKMLFVLFNVCFLFACASERTNLKTQTTTQEQAIPKPESTPALNCDVFLKKAKSSLLAGKEEWLVKERKLQIETATIEFSTNHKCFSENQVIFGILISLKYFDTDVNKYLCASVAMDVLATKEGKEIKFEFGDLEINSINVCDGTTERA